MAFYRKPQTREAEAKELRAGKVERLVATGRSRVTAERMVAIELGEDKPGRARRHALARH
jgi:hypothetical protein